MEIYEIVKKLVGEINPVGETNEDDKRMGNLRVMMKLVEKLVSDIDCVAYDKNKVEYSIKRAGEYADNFLRKDLRIAE